MVDLVATIRRIREDHRGTYWDMVWKLEKGREGKPQAVGG
jgi:hypothetical protein